MKTCIKISFFLIITFFINTHIKGQINGKLIGDDIWTTSNLNVTKFQNGDPIFEARTNEQWIKANKEKKPAWCYYQNNAQNGVIYGKLYNWYAINDPRGLAPKGWHISTRSDWEELISILQKDKRDVNEALKSQTGWKQYEYGGTTEGSDCYECNGTGKLWSNISYKYKLCVFCGGTGGNKRYIKKRIISGNGSNTSGFSAKPGANRYDNGDFSKSTSGGFGIWWLASDNKLDSIEGKCILIDNSRYIPQIDNYGKGYGSSIRLVKDNPVKIEKERIIQEEKLKQERILEEKRKKDSVSIVGNTVVIDNLVFAQYDFPKKMSWEDAKKACESIGNGWRLPTKEELGVLFKNKIKMGVFTNDYYWSSTINTNNLVWTQYFKDGYAIYSSKDYTNYVRAIRSF